MYKIFQNLHNEFAKIRSDRKKRICRAMGRSDCHLVHCLPSLRPPPFPFTVLLNCPSSFSQRVIKFMHFYEHTPSASGADDAVPPQRGVGIGGFHLRIHKSKLASDRSVAVLYSDTAAHKVHSPRSPL